MRTTVFIHFINRYSGSAGYHLEELVALAMRIPQMDVFSGRFRPSPKLTIVNEWQTLRSG